VAQDLGSGMFSRGASGNPAIASGSRAS
jgi:hypothetical protein